MATNQNRNRDPDPRRAGDSDQLLLTEFGGLWDEAEAIWDRHQNAPAFEGYVSADYPAVFDSLARLRGRVLSVLEWGSGLGVVTIMASRMGFEACGIEVESDLVEFSEGLAKVYGPQARFAQGSFIPDEFECRPADGSDAYRTISDVPAAYAELDMELRDFDLIYAYPWPDEAVLFRNIMRRCGRKGALLLIYDAREGIQLVRSAGR